MLNLQCGCELSPSSVQLRLTGISVPDSQDGLGYFSSVASATTQQTAPSGPPLQPGVQLLSSTAVILTWTAPLIYLQNGIITFYALNYTRLPNQYRADPMLPDSVITVVP